MSQKNYNGLLFIGDPHLEGRAPGFRKDNFPEVILNKIRWALDYAQQEQLLPAFLGDLFDKPRGNPNWLISRLIEILSGHHAIGIFGNHDVADPLLDENDSLSILVAAGCYRLVSESQPVHVRIRDRDVFIGGSSYREPIPDRFKVPKRKSQTLFDNDPLVVWMTHHDIGFPGYDNPKIDPHQIENVDLLINGHIHRQLEPVKAGRTLWITPGNISRRSRSEAVKQHVPQVTRVHVFEESFEIEYVNVPHEPFDEVFHLATTDKGDETEHASSFVTGLAELTARRTSDGAGLHQFLKNNTQQFKPSVADVVFELAKEVTEQNQD